MEPRSAQIMVATAGFLKVTLSAISSSARRSRRHAAHQRFPLAAIHLARLPLSLALGCARTTYHRQLRCMHQKRPWPEPYFVIPACLRIDIHLLPVFECEIFVTDQVHQVEKPGHWASINVLNFYTPELWATARRATRTWGAGATQAAVTTLLQ